MSAVIWATDDAPEFNRALSDWISVKVWNENDSLPKPSRCFGVFKDGELQGAVAFHNYQPQWGVIEFTGAATGDRWLSREVIREIAAYGFDHLGCQLMVIRTDPGNDRVIRIFSALGFEKFTIPRLRGRDKAEIIMTLSVETRDASPFIRRQSHGR